MSEPPPAPSAGPPPPAPAERQRRSRPGWWGWAALLCLGAVLLTAAGLDRRAAPAGDRTVGEVTRVGVRQGEAIAGYLRAAEAELVTLPPGAAYALVSFDAYLPPGRLPALLAGVEVARVIVRVPLPDRQTEVVRLAAYRLPQDVVSGMATLADRKDREAADQRVRAANAVDAELRRVYDTGAQVAAREAAAYRAACGCVYAALVRGGPDVLRALAARPGVRGVDPAPEVRRLERTVLTPPLPEQHDVARPPADTALVPTGPPVGDSSEAAPAVTSSSPPFPVGGAVPKPAVTS
ncbi:hypothetical protein [Micromonospora sp. KC213]|uniref:hypothetical protein n=1 Tax=Micromonospora sp. KC213 TaxID=2530378 RepID=UPI001A9CE2C5|nr:hypothetical protein [Micromonospora sp. KC213]